MYDSESSMFISYAPFPPSRGKSTCSLCDTSTRTGADETLCLMVSFPTSALDTPDFANVVLLLEDPCVRLRPTRTMISNGESV